jgi:CMP/dCMP kinase
MPSVGKTTAAEAISSKYHLKHIAGGDMLKEMAIDRRYTQLGSNWWDTKEGMKFLTERRRNPDFDREVDRRLISYVKSGGVVITSYTVPWICKLGLKIWFDASQRTRAKRLAGRDHISESSAMKVIRSRDSMNRRLYSKIYGIKFGTDLSVFNYVIKTDDLSAKDVAVVACGLVGRYLHPLGQSRPVLLIKA